MSDERVFEGQRLSLTLTAKDNDGDVISLSGKTVHFYTRDPSGNQDIDTTPTIATPSNGQAEHVFAAGDLDEPNLWMAKLWIDGDEIPSTRYVFRVYSLWDK